MSDAAAKPIDGAVAVVTGAGRGIGRAIATALAAAGAHVVVAARSLDELERLVSELEGAGGAATAIRVDVSNEESVQELVDLTVARLGTLDILVNNAGIVAHGRIVDTSYDQWASIFRTNVDGTFLCTRAALRVMSPGSSIVNVASTFGNAVVRGYAAYCASKAAILHFTRVAAAEAARAGVRINAVAPGYVETDLNASALADPDTRAAIERRIPLGGIANPDDLVPTILHLCGPGSSGMTGSVVTIDGGFALR